MGRALLPGHLACVGIAWFRCPPTLLAMVDAAIGARPGVTTPVQET